MSRLIITPPPLLPATKATVGRGACYGGNVKEGMLRGGGGVLICCLP